MKPFMKGDDGEEATEVLSVEVSGKKISVMRRTLDALGPKHPLANRFSP